MKMYQAHWHRPAPQGGFYGVKGDWFWTKKEATDDAKQSFEFVKITYWLVITCHKYHWQQTILNLMNDDPGIGTTERIEG
jgi:hypothetical protein